MRLNYFRIFLHFSVARPNLSEYLCLQEVRNPSVWNLFATTISRSSTCFPTTIYDVMKRIRSASPRRVLAHLRLTSSLCLLFSYLSDSLANHSRILLPPPFILPSFFSYRLPGLLPDETNWSELRDSAEFHLQFSKFRAFQVRFVGVLQFPSRLRPYEPFGKQLPVILAVVVFHYFLCRVY